MTVSVQDAFVWLGIETLFVRNLNWVTLSSRAGKYLLRSGMELLFLLISNEIFFQI